MKRYLPFAIVAVGIVAALWWFWPDVVKARQARQSDLDDILDNVPKPRPTPPTENRTETRQTTQPSRSG